MFDMDLSAQLAKVTVAAKAAAGSVRRIITVTFAREFDEEIADALGREAKHALRAMKARAISDVSIPMDALIVSGKLTALEDKIEIPRMRGVRAKAKWGKKGEDEELPPSIMLDFETSYSDDVWMFLGRNVMVYGTIKLKRLQQALAFPAPGGPSGVA